VGTNVLYGMYVITKVSLRIIEQSGNIPRLDDGSCSFPLPEYLYTSCSFRFLLSHELAEYILIRQLVVFSANRRSNVAILSVVRIRFFRFEHAETEVLTKSASTSEELTVAGRQSGQ
jgi:hypothetical protein